MLWFWALYAVLMIVSFILSPKPKTPVPEAPTPAGLEDFNIPTATAGREIPVLFGTRWIKAPNVVWYGDLHITAKTESTGGGGKKG